MVNHFLQKQVRELYDLEFKLKGLLETIYVALGKDRVSKQTVMDLNSVICDIREDGLKLVEQMAGFYHCHWD